MSRIAYTDCDPLIVGCTLYQSASLTDPWGVGIYYDGIECWQVNSSGVITGTTSCTPFVCDGAQCKNWEYSSIPSGGDIVYYYSCADGTLQSIGLSDTDPPGTFCNCNTVGNPFTSQEPGTTLTEIGTCGSTTTTTEAPATCYENTTINVTDTGWIRWTKCDGTIVNYFLPSTGQFIITDCIEAGTIRIATPFADLASWNNVVNGTACGTTTTTSTTTSTTTTSTTTSTTTTTTEPPAYNYYTFTPCGSGFGTDYRSTLSLGLNDVYTFQAYPPDRACYTITSITASPNSNDLPTIYGPLPDCNDENCQQL